MKLVSLRKMQRQVQQRQMQIGGAGSMPRDKNYYAMSSDDGRVVETTFTLPASVLVIPTKQTRATCSGHLPVARGRCGMPKGA